jgi:asparagine N-glycosylation enzyme membrane subunit Stt3
MLLRNGGKKINCIKRFFQHEAAQGTSAVIIAVVGILMAAGLTIWYSGVNIAFNATGILFLGLIAWLTSMTEKRS